MAYFDSPKNRALWEVELKKLRDEKELRSTGKSSGEAPAERKASADRSVFTDLPTRIRTSYKELVEEARQEHLAQHGGRAPREFVHTNEKQNIPVKKPKDLGKVM